MFLHWNEDVVILAKCSTLAAKEIVTLTTSSTHDDVIKWKHFPRNWPFVRGIHRSLVNSSHKGQWRGALMFSLICVWINGWVNNREAGDLRRYRAHHDVTAMNRWGKFRQMSADLFDKHSCTWVCRTRRPNVPIHPSRHNPGHDRSVENCPSYCIVEFLL